ncbi:MAG TPA: DUF448 domain-containing protein [Firmicutes bacterium]|nr:DUF448 domain-containing protein [Bacillota bacterium]
MKTRKIPMRSCVVTRERLPKQELIRIVKFDGTVKVDPTGKLNGKGCYLKKDVEVLEKAKKTRILDRTLEVEIDKKVYEEIEKMII